ncbi:phenylalanine--tRNA ligase subunit beta [Euhalothece natronophila Z-M001]|uniref:Phenylalanine--tRNA ligase beta subunit n=1 Tax=Euhalothece natronophila Z-M001 TaxID=522448 RepID=A0A5B8NKU5_9CHRO|nr:phenylalanine--tRNA ligase subunit beta [Euhalothece natronophila]QDZ38935.1 phenylalanine--tRNA ligase subunit beta [Euhalothece natronophila Z-M001]
MRVSLNWLQEFVEINLTPEELGEILTIAGFEVEEIEHRRTFAEGVVVGKVLEKNTHPNADKLSVCKVDIGEGEPKNIVCGAANVRPDIYVPVATVGSYLPVKELKIKRSKLRGVHSEGMICSLAELGLEKESEGIHIFSEDNLTLGEPVYPLLGLDDVVLDLTTTANRADALSLVGVAREVAALTGVPLKLPETSDRDLSGNQQTLQVKVTEKTACPAYIGTEITNLKIAPSPQWLQRRLQAAGVRPINNVVDVTNYVLLEWGQPLHAFDRERLKTVAGEDNLSLGVRLAQEKETLTTLDGQTRQLHPENLLITANDVPVALAGVMGGEETEVYDQTENIILEAALFEPVAVRRSARAQGLRTEASTRYERGVNQAELEKALQRAIALLVDLAQGTPTQQAIADTRPSPDQWYRKHNLKLDRIHHVLGEVNNREDGKLTPEDVERTLTALGCELTRDEKAMSWTVTVPPYRYHDLEREIDLIEEVARLYGYDYFKDTLPESTQPGYLSSRQQNKNRIREALRAVGLTEVLHYSLVKPEGKAVTLANPLFKEYSALRTELLSGLINAFSYNLARGNGALNGFEMGRRFWNTDNGIGEADTLAGIMGGEMFPQGKWVNSGQGQSMSWYQAKGILEAAFTRLGLSVTYQATEEDSRLHPGRTAILFLEKQRLGIFGQLHPQFRQEHDLPDAVYVFSFDLELLLNALAEKNVSQSRFSPFSTYPAVARDMALYAPVDLPVADLIQVMEKAGGNLLQQVELFDEYRGENVPEGQRSLAFSLIYQARDRTLTDEEVEPSLEKVRKALNQEFTVTLRS